ncbi:MAG: DUF342 domain-containing protein [bacterium]|nr:DUF342 domain-containing protein [bacterium]
MKETEGKNVKLNLSADKYKAYISIRPDSSTVKMTLPELNNILQRHGVVFGVKKEVLMIVISKLKQGSVIEKIMVAEGIEPFEGMQPALEYKFEISSKPKEMESGKTDYREIATMLNVKKGRLLAVKQKLLPPRQGITVTGEKTTFKPIQDIHVAVGENIAKEELEEKILYKAACDGALQFENRVMRVCPTLDIREDVDFSVGNIYFEGDVKIGRDVLPDFVVEAHGNIKLWGSAIACQLKAHGDIEVRAGIVGKNKGEVHCGGTLNATFVENATLQAKGDINIKNGIIGSKVFGDGSLSLAVKRSRIVGSSVKVAKGITTFNAGSRFDTGTHLFTGINPEKEQEYYKIKKMLDTKWGEAKELEKRYGRSTLEAKVLPRHITETGKQDIKKWNFLKKQIKNILQQLKKTEGEMYDYDVVIKIKETLFPRVELQIGKHKLTTSKEYYGVTVSYSKEVDKLVIK